MSSPKKAKTRCLPSSHIIQLKEFQAVDVYLGYFATSSYGNISLIKFCYSVWVYLLGAQLSGSTPAYILI